MVLGCNGNVGTAQEKKKKKRGGIELTLVSEAKREFKLF